MIDFMVYFVSPILRESFGRVLAEGVAAGKIVITDPDTAKSFGGAVIGARPEDVDGIIADYLTTPAQYVRDVRAAQDKLDQFSPAAFERLMQTVLNDVTRHAA